MTKVRRPFIALLSAIVVVLGVAPAALAAPIARVPAPAVAPDATRLAPVAASPAAAAGVLLGDVLLEFDNHPIESPEELLDLLLGDRVGRSVPLKVLRGGSVTELQVTVGERPVQ